MRVEARTRKAGSKGSRGFSMLELMIAVAISLVSLLAIERAVSMGMNNKRVISESLDAEGSANMAIAQLESELKSSGYGVSSDPFIGCQMQVYLAGSWISAPMNPLTIGAGAGPDGSDILTVARSHGDTGFANTSLLTTHVANSASDYQVSNRYNINVGDQVVVADGAGNCAQFAVSALPSGLGVTPTAPGVPFPVTTLGAMMDAGPLGVSSRIYQIDAATKSKLTRDEVFDGSVANSVAEQIVFLKAYYGKDPTGVMKVTAWDQSAPSTAADWKRVLAVRVAIVARSQASEMGTAGNGACSGGNCPTPSSIKLWPDETMADGSVVAGPVYAVSAANQHFRHVVRAMIVPMRNNIWNNN